MSYTLLRAEGFGSVCIELALELLGQAYERVEADPLGSEADKACIREINPLVQIPTLKLPDGRIMTESASILIYLGDLDGQYTLAPRPNDVARVEYLRWLGFLSAGLYSTFTISDGPERFHPDPATHDVLLEQANERRKQLWIVMEAAFADSKGTFLLGDTMSLLDIYVAMMSYWSPRRDWFETHCPRLLAAVRACEQNPIVRSVFERNYTEDFKPVPA
ncbi:glutathione S-transferase family protein [Maricaulis sp.]|uniref:glutathione S-transferase family protein n=1 Tax=unclassified Maricaulis TaxID=2632371 RepID=UPI001AFECFFE|nr:glutathione S-transferase family protein [Maricaulis sp.]MBO6796571.1 glutathione S-transferase family protein [Maricaulis sp.]